MILEDRNKQNETANQIIAGFLMHLGEAPWEAEQLIDWLDRGGFQIVLKPKTETQEPGVSLDWEIKDGHLVVRLWSDDGEGGGWVESEIQIPLSDLNIKE